MDTFWAGFFKKAEEATLISDWIAEARKKELELKSKKKDTRCDPRQVSEAPGTEVWNLVQYQ